MLTHAPSPSTTFPLFWEKTTFSLFLSVHSAVCQNHSPICQVNSRYNLFIFYYLHGMKWNGSSLVPKKRNCVCWWKIEESCNFATTHLSNLDFAFPFRFVSFFLLRKMAPFNCFSYGYFHLLLISYASAQLELPPLLSWGFKCD